MSRPPASTRWTTTSRTAGRKARDPSAGFDTLKYLAANPDVAAAHINPLDHFINSGI